MKSYEIKRFDLGSVFKFYFVTGVVFGVAITILLLITGITLKNIGLELGTFGGEGGPLQVGAAILGVVLVGLAYGLLTGVFSMIGAWIYNLFAAVVGGIVIKVKDQD